MKDTIAEKKNSLDVNDSRLGTAGEKISELEDIKIETIQNEAQSKKYIFFKLTKSQWLVDNNKQSNMCVIRDPEGKRERGEQKKYLWMNEIIAKTFPILIKTINLRTKKLNKP